MKEVDKTRNFHGIMENSDKYGNVQAVKGEGWALPFISCAQDTVGL